MMTPDGQLKEGTVTAPLKQEGVWLVSARRALFEEVEIYES